MASKVRITATDRAAMRLATMACWWPGVMHKDTVWSGIANELEYIAKRSESLAYWNHEEPTEALELFRLAKLATAAQVAEWLAV